MALIEDGGAVAVLWLPPRQTLALFDLLPDLLWTPIEMVEVVSRRGKVSIERKPMMPGCGFVAEAGADATIHRASSAGIFGCRLALFNGYRMLTDAAGLAGLRAAEAEASRRAPQPPAPADWRPRLGEQVRVAGHWFDGMVGIIKRLDASDAHLEVPGASARMTVRRSLLRPLGEI